MSQGDLGGSMFAIMTHRCGQLHRQGGREQGGGARAGEVVGEMSLFTGDRRTATVPRRRM
jgi:CRP-like cAMP-binding protein